MKERSLKKNHEKKLKEAIGITLPTSHLLTYPDVLVEKKKYHFPMMINPNILNIHNISRWSEV